MAQVLILHGWQNRRPDGHWQRWLAEELGGRGHEVRYPQLPEPDAPVRGEWLAALDDELRGTDPEQLTVVAHSLGCLLWVAHARARAAAGLGDPVARRVLLAAPPSDAVVTAIPEIAPFATSGDVSDERGAISASAVAAALTAASGEPPVVVAGDVDPYSPVEAEGLAARFDLERVVVEGGGHLTIDDGFGPFPLLLELVVGVGAAR
ncbi:RBBP9/YdeN family alpha/beta hydrolase [Agromyces lapidis]|uniref:RBBP9/YdeN family alpha/beta hydrolase n=1 Tax=Agromyces lapidis TaxID=279574 RepID=A0ABV5SNH0_9MICO|nr:alpha/beta hydrolase [Agromyces lapidis]